MRASRSRCSRQCISESASVAERDSRQSGAKRAGDHRLGGPARGRASSPAEARMKSGWTGCTVPAAICIPHPVRRPRDRVAARHRDGRGRRIRPLSPRFDGVLHRRRSPFRDLPYAREHHLLQRLGGAHEAAADRRANHARGGSFVIRDGPDGPLASAARPGRAVELCDERDDPVPLHGRGCGRHRRAGLDRVFRQHRRAGRHRPDAADAELQRRSGFQCELPRRLLCADRQLRGRPPRQHGQELLDHRTGPGAHVLRAEERNRGLRVPRHRLQHRERGYGLPVRHAAPPRRNVGAALPAGSEGSRGEGCPRTTTSR